jgi:NDP-sugar pyrophosphorylase family protein
VEYVPEGEYMDLPNLVLKLAGAGEPVGSHVFDGYWLDIGRHEDYEQAILQFEELRPMLMRETAEA